MKPLNWILALGCAVPLLGFSAVSAEVGKKTSKEPISFGTLQTASPDAAKAQALNWLKSTGKTDPSTLNQVEVIWSQEDRPVLERVTATLALGDAEAAKLVAEARDPSVSAPQAVPAILKDKAKPVFYRANLALAYAKALGQRRVHEEALDSLRAVKPEDVVDPGAFFFTKAVSEHALMLKKEAQQSIVGIVEDVVDAPERYRTVAVLMLIDMGGWKDKDLGDITRLMDNSERRLGLSRGGPQTQKIQKRIVQRLDEEIKKLENQCKGCCQCNGGGCPNGGPPQNGGGQGGTPMQDSNIATNSGPGKVDQVRLKGLAEQWGKLPEKERAKAMADLTRDVPPRYREVIENYFKKIASSEVGR